MFEFAQLIMFIASLVTCLMIFERRLDTKIEHIDQSVKEIKQDVRELRRDMSEMTAKMSDLSVRMAVQDTEFKSYVMYGSRLRNNETLREHHV